MLGEEEEAQALTALVAAFEPQLYAQSFLLMAFIRIVKGYELIDTPGY
jgi:hypothetical protein